MGQHYWNISEGNLHQYFKHIWSTNLTYCASTTFIKLAILLQYLRLFDMQSKVARTLTWILIVCIAMWGTIFFFLALFACKPIAKNWDFSLPGTCVAWGSKDPDAFFATWASHSASNMLMDFLVLLLPIPFLRSLRMQGRTRLGLIALFTMGGWSVERSLACCYTDPNVHSVALLSVARMISLSIKRAGTVPIFDPTWATPPIYICSVLEVNIAIICASIPIFWPFVTSLAMNKILVVNEIEVRTDRRESQNYHSGLAEQGAGLGLGGHPDLDKGIASRIDVLGNASDSKKHTRGKSKSSNTSAKGLGMNIELGTRMSTDSQRSLSHQTSLGDISFSSISPPELNNPLDPPRNPSCAQYADRYAQAWAVPDFDKTYPGRTGGNTYTTTVERAEIPYDHIKALER